MTPKTPNELREQVERQNAENESAEGNERTAEGMETPTPTRGEFFSNLEKASKPEKD